MLASKTRTSLNSFGKTSSIGLRSYRLIITNNEPQFYSITVRTFCSELKIKNLYSTPCFPQINGQTKATNKTLLTTLKKMMEEAKGKWVDELSGVLWAYQKTPGRLAGTSPFALAYGMKAIIPMEVGMPTTRSAV